MRRFLLRPVWLAILICVLVPTAALAAERAEPITVRAVFEGQLPLAGMRFDAYRVADRSSDGTWSLEPRFKAYRSRLETQSGDGNAWAALARVLERVALMDEACLPDDSAETDEEGAAVFDALEPGLYLMSGQSVCVNRQIYTPSPLLIVCPTECEAEMELTCSPEKADYSVQIVWDDTQTPEQRPESLTVQLMCDGKAYGRPVLFIRRTGLAVYMEQSAHGTLLGACGAGRSRLPRRRGAERGDSLPHDLCRSAAGTGASAGDRGSAGNRKSRLAGGGGARAARCGRTNFAKNTEKIKKSLTVNLLDTVR